MNKSNKSYIFIAVTNVFSSKIVIGITANAVLLLFHVLTFLLQHKPKPADLTVAHLALIHLLMLIIRAFMNLDIFGFQDIWDDIKCKLLLYLYRVLRALSLCTTCLLSVLQAITLSPRSSFLAKFKHKSPHHCLCCILILWVFNILINVRVLVSVQGPTNETLDFWFISESCTVTPTGYAFQTLFTVIGMFRDVFLIGLMALSSGYMVTLLCRHKRQCQHLHSTSLSPKASPEQRATQTILLLMSFFVVMYFLDSIISSFYGAKWKKDPSSIWVQMLVGNGYATITPVMLLSTDKRIRKFVRSTLGKERKSF